MSFKNGNPAFLYQGADDQSTRQVPSEPRVTPVHLALFHLFTQRGPTDLNAGPLIVDTQDAYRIFGQETFNLRSKYATHATVFAKSLLEQAGLIAIERIAPNDLNNLPKTAAINIAADVLAMNVPQYERATDGTFLRDGAGAKIPTGETLPGFKVKFIAAPLVDEVGGEVSRVGSMTEGAIQSQIIPLFDVPASYFGQDGDNIGFRMWAPTVRSTEPADEEAMVKLNSYRYRFQAVRRASPASLGAPTVTLDSSQSVEFSFDPDAWDETAEQEMYFEKVLDRSYRDLMPADGSNPVFGPYGDVYVYTANLEGLLEDLYDAEVGQDTVPAVDGKFLFNLLSGVSPRGVPYHTYQVLGQLDGGIEFTETSTWYLQGGKDGTTTAAHFETRVGEIYDGMTTSAVRYEDFARYPFTVVYDSGYTQPIKLKLGQIMSVRRDVVVLGATQDVAQPQNTVSEESSIAAALRSAFRLHPESTYFGTPTCRAAVIGQSSYLLRSTYKKLVPGTLEMAIKLQRYMGGDRFQNSASLNLPANKELQFLSPAHMNATSKSSSNYVTDWDVGLVSARFKDNNTLFYPAFKTVYDDDTSVLNSILIAFVLGDVVRGCYWAWTELTGRNDLSNAQLIEKSDQLILQWVANKYDNLVEIIPRTNLTPADLARNFSWSTEVTIRANGMKTVNQATIITQRREETA